MKPRSYAVAKNRRRVLDPVSGSLSDDELIDVFGEGPGPAGADGLTVDVDCYGVHSQLLGSWPPQSRQP